MQIIINTFPLATVLGLVYREYIIKNAMQFYYYYFLFDPNVSDIKFVGYSSEDKNNL